MMRPFVVKAKFVLLSMKLVLFNGIKLVPLATRKFVPLILVAVTPFARLVPARVFVLVEPSEPGPEMFIPPP